MAVTVITPEVLTWNTFDADALAMTAPTTAADGFTIGYGYQDSKMLLVFENTSADTAYDVTVKTGDSIQGVADITQEIAFGDKALIVIESGRFKNVSGTNKGKVLIIPENAAVKMAAVVLP